MAQLANDGDAMRNWHLLRAALQHPRSSCNAILCLLLPGPFQPAYLHGHPSCRARTPVE